MNVSRTTAISAALAAGSLLIPVSPASARTVDEVLDAHVEARGGADAWAAVQATRATGTFTSFSKPGPATVVRSRDGYRAEVTWNENPVTTGWDGEEAWRIMTMFGMGAWPRALRDQDRIVLDLDLDFPNALFVAREKGYDIELVPDTDFEGQDVVAVKLTRPNEEHETWYLDPETWLEVAREAPASEFGRPDRQITVFDDFRSVGDVVIPHYEETQWYTRLWVYELDEVELNPDVDPSVFARPPVPGMEDLVRLAGDWAVTQERMGPDGAWAPSGEYPSSIEVRLNGAMIEETLTTSRGTPVVSTWSVDPYRETWKYTSINDFFPFLDVLEGKRDEDGAIVVDNLASGTSLPMGGEERWSRLKLVEPSPDGFVLERATSTDAGETWTVDTRWTYVRPDAEGEGEESESGGAETAE